jgi:signal transduction histidine kinase
VFLYRDGFRIEPFGSSAADWLGIGEKRAKRAGHAHIVPSRLFGFVSISRRKHGGLKDTTSREALLDTAEARALVHLLKKGIIDFLEEQIRTGIAMPRWEESRARKATELQKARFQALNVMSSGVAHELRQPLQAIRMEAGNIATRLRQLAIDDPIIRAAARCIDTSIERIDQRIQLISALTGGKLDANERVDMALIVQEECTLLERRIQENNIDLTLEVPKDQDANVSDPLVRMVVKNMVENAVNALAEVKDGRQRRVAVGLSKKGFKHLLKVKDNAMGIPAEIQPRIFARFATDTTGGMGVGLYVCQLLLKSHGGEISFQTKDRVGSEFTATFVDEEGSID